MKHIFNEIEKINAGQKLYFVKIPPLSKKIFLKPVEKAKIFLDNKFPKEFETLFSNAIELGLYYKDKSGDWDPDKKIANVFGPKKMFDEFKQHPEPLTQEQNDYIKIKKSFPCSAYFPEELNNYNLFNEITRQKVLIPIIGTTNSITVDFYTSHKKGYVLKFLDARNPENICELDLTLTQFLEYFIYFGTFDYWFLAFAKKSPHKKKKIYSLAHINEIKREFGKLSTHHKKITELEKLVVR